MKNENFGVIIETEIPLLSIKFGVAEATIKKDLKALNCEIYKLRSKLKGSKLEGYAEKVKTLKLKQERNIPKYVRGRSVRTLLPQNLWSKVRNIVLESNHHCCVICGYTTDNLPKLQVHEEWEIDKENTIIKLTGLSLLCHMCHSSKHIEHTYFRTADKGESAEVLQKLNIHFMNVNECSQETLFASQYFARKEKLNLLPPGELGKFLEEEKRLEKAEWSYRIFEEMPLRSEVIIALKKKVNVLI